MEFRWVSFNYECYLVTIKICLKLWSRFGFKIYPIKGAFQNLNISNYQSVQITCFTWAALEQGGILFWGPVGKNMLSSMPYSNRPVFPSFWEATNKIEQSSLFHRMFQLLTLNLGFSRSIWWKLLGRTCGSWRGVIYNFYFYF